MRTVVKSISRSKRKTKAIRGNDTPKSGKTVAIGATEGTSGSIRAEVTEEIEERGVTGVAETTKGSDPSKRSI